MKRILGLVAAFLIVLSSMAYAGGDQNCGSVGQGATGTTAGGDASQNRAAAD